MKTPTYIYAILLSLFFSGIETSALDYHPSAKLAKLLKKINKASDPGNKGNKITSQKFIFEVEIPMTKIKFSNITLLKAPDKRKMITQMPNIMTEIEVFDGTEGWKLNSKMGFQPITGPALNFLKYSTIAANTILFEDKYAKIELSEGTFEVGKFKCYQLTCHQPAEYKLKPQIIYIDNKEFLVRKMEMVIVSQMGEVPAVGLIEEYKNYSGITMPSKMQIQQMGMTIQMKLLTFIINPKITDSEFKKTQSVQTATSLQ